MENFIIEDTVLTNEECDKIVAFIEENRDKFVLMNYHKKNQVQCNTLLLGNLLDENVNGAKEIDELIHSAFSRFLKEGVYPYFNLCNVPIPSFNLHDSGYELREISGPTLLHQDGIEPKLPSETHPAITYRIGTFVLSLHDSKDTLAFPAQDLQVKLTKGKAVFFPPFFTHPHFTNYGGEKTYRVQTWLYSSDAQ